MYVGRRFLVASVLNTFGLDFGNMFGWMLEHMFGWIVGACWKRCLEIILGLDIFNLQQVAKNYLNYVVALQKDI